MVIVPLLKRTVITLLSFLLSVIAGTFTATPTIAWLNYTGTDGPTFPAPLVAFGFVALPIGILLLLLSGLFIVWELALKKELTLRLLPISILMGALLGGLWLRILDPTSLDPLMLITLMTAGMVQAGAVFAIHWLNRKFDGLGP